MLHNLPRDVFGIDWCKFTPEKGCANELCIDVIFGWDDLAVVRHGAVRKIRQVNRLKDTTVS
jgi:hypothetical protein